MSDDCRKKCNQHSSLLTSSLLVTCHSSLVTHHSSIVTHHLSLLTICPNLKSSQSGLIGFRETGTCKRAIFSYPLLEAITFLKRFNREATSCSISPHNGIHRGESMKKTYAVVLMFLRVCCMLQTAHAQIQSEII